MTLYYVDYYRDFCNTYTVYAVAPADRDRFERFFPDATRIDRREAIRLGWSRVREAKHDGEFWPAGFAECRSPFDLPSTPGEALENCRRATAEAIDDREVQEEGAAESAARS